MQRKLIVTKDGSHSIAVGELSYHSTNGAIQESKHVFIEAGLHQVNANPVRVFEMGLGTGLNALLTLMDSDKTIFYECVEPFPLEKDLIIQLNYCELLGRPEVQPAFEHIHFCNWEEEISITQHFHFKKSRNSLEEYSTSTKFDLIYFDAFAPTDQQELWTKEIFDKMYSMLVQKGILVTYSSKGSIRRNLVSAGFAVEKIPGPPGKREMVRAIKK